MGVQASIAQSKVLSGILEERFTNLKVVDDKSNTFYLEFPKPKVGLNAHRENVEIVGFRISTLVSDFNFSSNQDDSNLDDSDLDDLDLDDSDSPETITYSIALVDAERKDQYIKKIHCFGCKQFSNINEVIGEINRVLEFSTFS